VRNAHDESAAILSGVVNTIGNGDAGAIRAEVVIEDPAGAAFPTRPGFLKLPTSSRFLVSTLMMGR